jgi:hypothetical protein
MAVSPRLLSLSRFMAWLSVAGFVLLPLVTVYVFLRPEQSAWLMFNIEHLGAILNQAVPLQFRLIALACEMVPVGFSMWALWSLRDLFLHYAKSEVFSHAALNALTNVGKALMGGVIAGIIMQGAISLALTWSLGQGHRAISIGFGSNDIAGLFMAGVVFVIARVMAEARRVAEENAGFV